jgi:hypothetical protein
MPDCLGPAFSSVAIQARPEARRNVNQFRAWSLPGKGELIDPLPVFVTALKRKPHVGCSAAVLNIDTAVTGGDDINCCSGNGAAANAA